MKNLSLAELNKAVSIREEIDMLEEKLALVLSGDGAEAPASTEPRTRPPMSESTRAKIAQAQKLRWRKERLAKV